MKTHLRLGLLMTFLGLTAFAWKANAQNQPEKLGLPGDNLNLYAVMDLFQQSPTLEEFEKSLNSEDQKVNNLDLNNDGDIDYIKVIDNVKGTTHNIVLRVDVRKKESQDVAVFVVDKNKDGSVSIQLIGDKDLYGKDYIVEPATTQGTPNPGYKAGSGNTTINNYNTTNNTYNNNTTNTTNNNNGYNNGYNSGSNIVPVLSSWLIVSHIFSPTYSPWYSPWYWGYYPAYWRPWTPYYWYDYNYHWYNHHSWHHNWYYRPRMAHYHPGYNNYYTHRMRSTTYQRNRQNGVYQNAYSYNNAGPRPSTGRPLTPENARPRPTGNITRPGNSNFNPDARPDRPNTRPAIDNNGGTRPATIDRDPNNTRPTPNTRPTSNDREPINTRPTPNTRPATIDNNGSTRPTPNTRPVQNDREPINTRPTPNTRPTQFDREPNNTRPMPNTRPAQYDREPSNSRPTPTTRPAPNQAPSTRPMPAPSNTRPAPSAPTSRPMPAPNSRPAPASTPSTRPSGGNDRMHR